MTQETRNYRDARGWLFSIQPLLINLVLMAFVVYGNTLVLIPLLLQKRKIILYILGIIVLTAVCMYVRSLNQSYWDNIVWSDYPMTVQSYFEQNLFYSLWFIVVSSMLFFTQKWTEQRQQVKNIQISQLQTELKYLRAQVNPHFLFNGLNTIYGSIDRNNQEARNILLQFADLLRYNLYEADVDWVELEKETFYLENYVSLQRARSNSNLNVQLDISIEEKGIKVAPLIFLAFVENAFKFSTRDDNRANSVKISLHQKGNRILFECSNSYEDDEQQTGGIGLTNVQRRLELLYKDKYTLDIRKEQSTFYVKLELTV